MITHMKTTVELPDALLTEAKAVAARRRTTLKAMIEHALKREIRYGEEIADENLPYEINAYGFPVFRKTSATVLTSEMVYEMMDELGI
jgi:hypothetical protein